MSPMIAKAGSPRVAATVALQQSVAFKFAQVVSKLVQDAELTGLNGIS